MIHPWSLDQRCILCIHVGLFSALDFSLWVFTAGLGHNVSRTVIRVAMAEYAWWDLEISNLLLIIMVCPQSNKFVTGLWKWRLPFTRKLVTALLIVILNLRHVQSWTKVLGQICTYGVFSHAPNKQSHVNSTTPVQPFPPPHLQCWTHVHAISPVPTLYLVGEVGSNAFWKG